MYVGTSYIVRARACCEHFTLPTQTLGSLSSSGRRIPMSLRVTVHVRYDVPKVLYRLRKCCINPFQVNEVICSLQYGIIAHGMLMVKLLLETAACSIVRSSLSLLVAPNRTRLVVVLDLRYTICVMDVGHCMGCLFQVSLCWWRWQGPCKTPPPGFATWWGGETGR